MPRRPDEDSTQIDDRSSRNRTPDPRYSQSLEHGVALLECFSAVRPVIGIAELADMIGLSRSTTHRYATTLAVMGFLEQDGRRRYRLSNGALNPGMSAIDAVRAETPAAREVLEDLREQTGHTVSMAALEGADAVYVHRLYAHGAGQYEADLEQRVGACIPLHCTAIGKALLASLSEPEQRGLLAQLALNKEGPNTITRKKTLTDELARVRTGRIATCDQEQAPGVQSIAAAIVHPGRTYPLAIGVTVPAQHHTIDATIALYGEQIIAAAERI